MKKRPRRLLTIAHAYSVTLSRRLANEMARAGRGLWEVTAVAPLVFYENYRPVLLTPAPDEPARLEAVKLHFPKRIHTMFYERRVRDLLRLPCDLVHCWEEPFNLAGAQIAWWTPRATPFVFWTAQNLPKSYPPPFAQLERYTFNRSAAWLACGQTTVETMLPRGYGGKPHRILPLGVDVEQFAPNAAQRAAIRQRLGWTEDGPPVVGYLGRFVSEKGLLLLTQALHQLTTPWRALFVGDGPLAPQLRDWAAPYGNRVQIVTGVKHDRVPHYLNAMDVLAAPSQTTAHWREQQGRMLIEAFACGVPVLASDSGEIPHVVQDAGVIAGERDAAAWTKALQHLLEDESARSEFAQRGLERAHSTYAWPVIARRHLAFFDELLDARPTG
jgi:glycosyltransferase involved in cell wall biosynthesis